MEPCAPGTEDDIPMFPTKRDHEIERLIGQKAVLRDGKYRNVFERSFIKGNEHWYCNACECPVMGRIFTHEMGRRHTFNLNANGGGPELRKEDEKKEEDLEIEIAPGEPAPPGFEEEAVRQATLIQSTLDGFKSGPLLALEYLIELHDVDRSKEPLYLCVLCDKKGDPRTVLTHLSSYNHISFFLRRHFPKCWRKLVPFMTKTNKKDWQNTMQRVAEAIERQFGRLKPTACEKSKFDNEKERSTILEKIMKSKHFSEQGGYTFEEYIVLDKLSAEKQEEKPPPKKSPSPPRVLAPNQRLKEIASKPVPAKPKAAAPNQKPGSAARERKDSLSSVSSVSSDVGRPDRPRQADSRRESSPVRGSGRYQRGDDMRRIDSRPRRPFNNRSPPRHERFERKLPYERRRSPSPKRRSSPRRQDNLEDENDKMMEQKREELRKIYEFRKLSRAIENDLQKNLQKYEKNPEKHPQYNEEWKKFWNKRYKELQAQGVDVSKFDFKPEWIVYWNRRMVELHSDEVREKKEALRKRLALPDEIKPIVFKINPPAPGMSKVGPNLPVTALADQENDVIIIDDERDTKQRSPSPWEKEKSWNRERPGSPYKRERRRSISPGRKAPARSPPRKMVARSPPRRGSRSPRRSPVRKSPPRRSPVKRSPPRRSPARRISPRRRSPTRAYDRPRSRDRSHSRNRSMSRNRSKSTSRNATHSRNLSKERSSYRSRSRSRNRRSISMDRFSDRRAPARESPFDRDLKSKDKYGDRRLVRESSFDRDMMAKEKHQDRMMVRESSFERDLKAKDRIRTVADLPWERQKGFRMAYDRFDGRMKSRKPMILPEPVMPEEEEDNGEVNVVDVLRILTALEDKLGLLGSKVIDLLAQALAMEKKEANSSESLLDSEINCVLFETAKEKLKGQLQAGLVDAIQERAFKKAIKKIASLIHLAGSRKAEKPKAPPKANPLSVPGVGAVDKAAIAKQITNALIAQGKTDVTEAELEQLINAVVGMAEATKNSSKPMTTASFLQQLSGGDTSTDNKKTEVTELDKLTEPLTPSPRKNSPNMDNLSDSDLQTLLQNFKDLSTDEQHNLINYLKKLELREPERVEKLRQFVNLEPGRFAIESNPEEDKKKSSSRESPFSGRLGGVNPASGDLIRIESDEEEDEDTQDRSEVNPEQDKPQKIHVDSEEDDYTFEDVVKSVSKNVKDKELLSNMKIVEQSMKMGALKAKADVDLSNAKDLISSLMSNITKSNADSSRIELVTQSSAPPSKNTSDVLASADFAKTLSNINVSNLTNIVNTFKDFGSSLPRQEVTKVPSNNIESNPNARKMNFDLDQLNKPSEYDSFNIDPDYLHDEASSERVFGYDNAPMAQGGMPNRGIGGMPAYDVNQVYRGDQDYGGDQRYGADQGYGYNDTVPEPVPYPSYHRDSAPGYEPGRGNDYYPERAPGYGAERGMGYGKDTYAHEREFDSRYPGPGASQEIRPAFGGRGRPTGQFPRHMGNNEPDNYYQRGPAEQRNNPRFNNYDRWY